jgi:hypothetical protein
MSCSDLKAAGAEKGRVEEVFSVRKADDEGVVERRDAVHKREELVDLPYGEGEGQDDEHTGKDG